MPNRAIERARNRYEELFPTDSDKAKAFDKIAEKFYMANFGVTPKSDIEVLMFSVYLEQILDSCEGNMSLHSDYALSKLLGLTQNRVATLKLKKELQYPYENFSWENSLAQIINNYRYENGKIKLYIPDITLFYEIKNVIENAGGYIDVQLNKSLLQVNPEYFVDVIAAMIKEENKDKVKKDLCETLKKHSVSTEDFDKKSIGELLKGRTPNLIAGIVGDLIGVCIPGVGPVIGSALKKIVEENFASDMK